MMFTDSFKVLLVEWPVGFVVSMAKIFIASQLKILFLSTSVTGQTWAFFVSFAVNVVVREPY